MYSLSYLGILEVNRLYLVFPFPPKPELAPLTYDSGEYHTPTVCRKYLGLKGAAAKKEFIHERRAICDLLSCLLIMVRS